MFFKGSRYRNLEESSPVNSKGERQLIKNVRLIPFTEGRFEHTVSQGERLDLLAYKYYRNPTRWWQICDANPGFPYPSDLLDQEPVAEEKLTLTHPDFESRFHELIAALKQTGSEVIVRHPEVSAFSNQSTPVKPDFIKSTVVVVYDQAITRQAIVKAIEGKQFHILNTFDWPMESLTAEAFTFDDEQVKKNWHELIKGLHDTPGLIQINSQVTESSLHLVYNKTVVTRQAILTKIHEKGFTAETISVSRISKKIIIPPDQIG